MLEYEDDHFDDIESTHSLDSEFDYFDVPSIRSLKVKRALTSANEKLRRSTREILVSRLDYNNCMAYHYAFMMNVATVRELEIFPKQPRIRDGSKP